jgi:arylsulfatase A-like enzyme
VPCIARWPGRIAPASRQTGNALTFDLFATSLAVAGVPLPAGTDAVDLSPVMRGEKGPAPARELYFSRREGGPAYGGKSYEALIKGDWKLLQNDPYSPLELYNLKDDPQEKNNLARARPAVVRELQAALRQHVQQAGATPWQPADRR